MVPPEEMPRRATVLNPIWVLSRKCGTDGKQLPGAAGYKARVVADGSRQPPHSYGETSAGVVNFPTLLCLFAVANQYGWHMESMDVSQAFLHAQLMHEIYIRQPPGYRAPAGQEHWLLRLLMSLYGLKQAGFLWAQLLSAFLVEIGFRVCPYDRKVFIRRWRGTITVVPVFVDDMIAMGNSRAEIERTKALLGARFKVKNLGEVEAFLGMRIRRDKVAGVMTIDLEGYTRKLLDEYGMTNARPASLPNVGSAHDILPPATEKERVELEGPARELIGKLQFLANRTRADLIISVSFAARLMPNASISLMVYLKGILRYLAGTAGDGLTFRRQAARPRLVTTADGDYAMDKNDRKSQITYVTRLGDATISVPQS